MSRRRKLCKPTHTSISISRAVSFHNRIVSFTIRSRLIEQMNPDSPGMAKIEGSARALRFGTELPAAAAALPTQSVLALLHVDGAHGSSALLSAKYRALMDGIDLADSLIWDTHKMLATSALCGAAMQPQTLVAMPASSSVRTLSRLVRDGL